MAHEEFIFKPKIKTKNTKPLNFFFKTILRTMFFPPFLAPYTTFLIKIFQLNLTFWHWITLSKILTIMTSNKVHEWKITLVMTFSIQILVSTLILQLIKNYIKHIQLNISRVLNPFTNFWSKKWIVTNNVAHVWTFTLNFKMVVWFLFFLN
jgi:hypothetical protein